MLRKFVALALAFALLGGQASMASAATAQTSNSQPRTGLVTIQLSHDDQTDSESESDDGSDDSSSGSTETKLTAAQIEAAKKAAEAAKKAAEAAKEQAKQDAEAAKEQAKTISDAAAKAAKAAKKAAKLAAQRLAAAKRAAQDNDGDTSAAEDAAEAAQDAADEAAAKADRMAKAAEQASQAAASKKRTEIRAIYGQSTAFSLPPMIIKPATTLSTTNTTTGTASTGTKTSISGSTTIVPNPTATGATGTGGTPQSTQAGATKTAFVIAPLDVSVSHLDSSAAGLQQVAEHKAPISSLDPTQAEAIVLTNVVITTKTPADEFLGVAWYGLGGLAIAATALVLAAAAGSLRARRLDASE